MTNDALRPLPMLLVMAAIVFLSDRPLPADLTGLFPGQDKVAHLLAYALFGATVIFAFPERFRGARPGLVGAAALAFPTLFGIGDELRQFFVPGRTPEFLDAAADGLGAAFAVAGWLTMRMKRQS